jgi:hypothetical protein
LFCGDAASAANAMVGFAVDMIHATRSVLIPGWDHPVDIRWGSTRATW